MTASQLNTLNKELFTLANGVCAYIWVVVLIRYNIFNLGDVTNWLAKKYILLMLN